MSVALNKFEKTVVFAGFVAAAGVLVGGAYVANTFFFESGDPVSVATLANPTEFASGGDISLSVSKPPTTQPASSFKLVEITPADTSPPVVSKSANLQVIEPTTPATQAAWITALISTQPAAVSITAPTTQPIVVAIERPTTRPMTVAIAAPATQPASATAAAPVSEPKVIKPYAIALPANRVTHMYASEAGSQPTWYEMKLEPAQMSELSTAAMAIARAQHGEAEEYDHLAVAWPKPDMTLTWWRPSELIDPNLLIITGPNGQDLWIAMSRRTGRTFFYASKPVDFTVAR